MQPLVEEQQAYQKRPGSYGHQGYLSTGIAPLDLAVGGYPRGKVVEIFGPSASGKTSLALLAIAASQRAGGVAAFIDAECSLDMGHAARLGVQVNALLRNRPGCAEQAIEITNILARSGGVDIVVIDTVAALVPKAELACGLGTLHAGLLSRVFMLALPRLTQSLASTGTCLLLVNQLRISGAPSTTPAGNAIKRFAAMRVALRRMGTIKEAGGVVGCRVLARVGGNTHRAHATETALSLRYQSQQHAAPSMPALLSPSPYL